MTNTQAAAGLPSHEALDDILLHAVRLAHEAGKVQLAHWRGAGSLQVSTKSNAFDIVTTADAACDALVRQGIAQAYPNHSILTEESDAQPGDSPWQWVVDPIDGTTNYNAGLPFFNISIAVRYRGEEVVGVVFAPALGELFTAIRGEGARLNGEPIACSNCQQLASATVSTGFPYSKASNPDNNLDNAARVMPLVRGFRRLGSAALELCYIAAGFLDAYWEMDLHEWDVAAGSLIAREAGAVVQPFRPNRGCSIIAGNPALAEQLAAIVK